MKIRLERQIFEDEYTLGELYINENHFCYTVEDKVRPKGEKVMHKTAIPTGTYKMIVNFSNRFKKDMPLLLNVENFEGIRIHSGNTAEDSSGCIIVGLIRSDNGVALSRHAFNKLMEKLSGQTDIEITIE